jgi:hypothetical protein
VTGIARIWMILFLKKTMVAQASGEEILAKMPGFFCGTSLHNGFFRL